MKLYIFNGPNLNLLGKREPDIYGIASLEDIKKQVEKALNEIKSDVHLEFKQTNSEEELINYLHNIFLNAEEKTGIIINPGAFTHYSYALGDALSAFKTSDNVQIIELHLSNPASREDFRKYSVVSPYVKGTIAGFGVKGYELAVQALLED